MSNYVDIDRHKTILGTLYVVFSLLNMVFVLLFTLVASAIIPIHVHEFEVLLIIRIIKYALITITITLTAPALVAGVGLLYKKDWALTLAFIIGIIGLLGFPIWTFIGIYSIIIFIMAQSPGQKMKPRQATDLIREP